MLGAQLLAQGSTASQRIGHFAEGALDGFFILGHGNVAPGLGRAQPRLVPSGIKNWQQQLRAPVPGTDTVGAAEQARQFGAGPADTRRQRDVGKESRTRRADVGIGGKQLLLGLTDVRSACEQIAGQARRHIGQQGRTAQQRRACWQVGRNRLAQQQHQRILVLQALTLHLRQGDLGRFLQRTGLGIVQLGGHAIVKAQLGEFERLAARVQGVKRQRQQLFVGQQAQVTIGHLGD